MTEMFVQGLFHGDFVVVLVPVDDTDTMEVVAKKVAHHTVNRRVAEQDRPMRVTYNGEVVPENRSIAELGIKRMDVLEVAYA